VWMGLRALLLLAIAVYLLAYLLQRRVRVSAYAPVEAPAVATFG
jgi:hypothetical protein